MRVLIVEDDPQVQRIVALELRHAGYSVAAAPDGRTGLEMALGERFDAIVLDRMLPDMDGSRVCREIRSDIPTPILMLTARGSVEDRVEGLDAGADDYLVKPFAPSELLARIRALMRRPPQIVPEDEELTVSDLTLSVARHEVMRGSERVDLTPREFDLLRYLMQNASLTLTRSMILDQVWGWSYGGGTNIVDVYIGYLRQKLDAGGRPPLIHTVRGVGYTLRPSEPSSPP